MIPESYYEPVLPNTVLTMEDTVKEELYLS
jgi:hypothetical protein